MTARIASLFAGILGIDLGLEWAGIGETTVAVEANAFGRSVIARHRPKVKRLVDVRETVGRDLDAPDLLVGGFPCQDISNAGKREGITGRRSSLWGHFARLIREARPRVVLIENVRALKTRGLDVVLQDLAAAGYSIGAVVETSAGEIGAPHRRDRIFIIAMLGEHLPLPDSWIAPRDRAKPWPTATATDSSCSRRETARGDDWKSNTGTTLLDAVIVDEPERWMTPTARDFRSGKVKPETLAKNARPLPEQVFEASSFPTPVERDAGRGTVRAPSRAGQTEALAHAVAWPAPTATAYGSSQNGICSTKPSGGTPSLWTHAASEGGRLNPEWVESLMGFPVGWTESGRQVGLFSPPLPPMGLDRRNPGWPAGRGEPQHAWEPPRAVTSFDPAEWAARIAALGNAVVPQVVELRIAPLVALALEVVNS